MSDGLVYWIGVCIASVVSSLVIVTINSVSDSSIFWAGCFVAVLCLLGFCLTVNEFRKM